MSKNTRVETKGNKGTHKRKTRGGFWPTAAFVILVVICIGFGSAAGVVLGTIKNTPKLEDLAYSPSVATKVYDVNGKLITNLHAGENRTPVSITKIPQHLQDAVVAVEDDRFYSHHGVNPVGILRALLVNLREGRSAQGGSTITQQLIKNTLLTPDKMVTRKIKEAILAIQLERAYTKEEILELYLNQIYFGHGAYGVEAAAQTYFGKTVSDLSLAECALVAGVTKGPRFFSPYLNPEAALNRRTVVLKRMLKLDFITKDEYDKAEAEPIKTVGLRTESAVAPYFIDYIREELIDRFGVEEVYKGGLSVYTTLDMRMQAIAEKTLSDGLPKGYTDSKGLQQPQGALISLDSENGYIRAMVGGRGTDKYNRATQALRQPGSAFKPIVYATALESGYTPDTSVVDEPVSYPISGGRTWSPANYDRKYRGSITLRKALEQSINTVAVKVCDQVGVSNVISMAKKLGITSLVDRGPKNDRNLSLALGGLTRGMTPLQMAVAYSVFSNGGYRVKPIAILSVQDKFGNLLEKTRPDRVSVIDPGTAFVLTDMLRGVIDNGTGRSADIGRPAAGKTGTTSDNTNAWFSGYTPDITTVVWIGNDEQAKTIRENGAIIGSGRAARMWGQYMGAVLKGTSVKNFDVPESVNTDLTTDLPRETTVPETKASPQAIIPQTAGEVEEALICKDSGELATDSCPADSVQARLFDISSGQEVDQSGILIPNTSKPIQSCELHPGTLLGTQ